MGEGTMVGTLLENPLVWGFIGSAVSGFITYKTASQKNKLDLSLQRETFVDAQMKELILSYKEDIASLKIEIRALTAKNEELVGEVFILREKNEELVAEVFSLRAKINEMEEHDNERSIN
jgi:BMFP domain-containing protein YqiC